MSAWDEIVATALVGSERQPLRISHESDPAGRLLAQIESDRAEKTILTAAAILAPSIRAGRRPCAAPTELLTAAEPDALRPCGTHAAAHLAEILLRTEDALLVEWLQLAADSGRRIPAFLLPTALDRGARNRALREFLLKGVDSRGNWLASQNPAWKYASGVRIDLDHTQLTEEVWQTGSKAERLALFGELRKRDPDAARDLLKTTWASESAEDRAAFLMAFSTGLTADDEPFLESALDEGRAAARRAAAQVLCTLPESRFAARMKARLLPRVSMQGGLLKGERLEVTLPEACDSAMQRDGIEPKPGREKVGERAFWMRQMIALAPPNLWVDAFKRSPDDLLRAAKRGEWWELLESGWRAAANRSRDAVWAEALLRWWLFESGAKTRPDDLFELGEHLSTQTLSQISLLTLERNPGAIEKGVPELTLLSDRPFPWSADLSRRVADGLRALARKKTGGWTERALLRLAALCMPPELAEEMGRGWPTGERQGTTAWDADIAEFLRILHLRADMRRALEEDAKEDK